MKKNLLILMSLFMALIGYSQTVGDTFVEDYITYEVTSITPDLVEAIDYDMAGGTVVVIPASVAFSASTFDVTRIGNLAFSQNQIVSVTIPDSVTYIGFISFGNNQTTLTDFISLATIPPTIQSSPNGSFGSRGNIDLIIPNGTSAAYAAGGWTGFNSVTEATPAQVGDTFVVDYITYEVTSIAPDKVEAIDYDMAGGTVVDIPASVLYTISTYAVTSIGNQAFGINNLTSVNIPDSITEIGFNAFLFNNLTNVVIPSSVISIDDFAFSNNNLITLNIPDNVTSIGEYAFQTNNLISLDIGIGVTNIGSGAFTANPTLTNVTSFATTPAIITTGTNDTFGNRSNINLTIPNGTENAYIAATWINFASVTLNISDLELANNIKVITTEDAIKVISPDSSRLENYTIYSIYGAKISSGKESVIATSSFAKGIYILKLNFERGTISKKVLVN